MFLPASSLCAIAVVIIPVLVTPIKESTLHGASLLALTSTVACRYIQPTTGAEEFTQKLVTRFFFNEITHYHFLNLLLITLLSSLLFIE